MCDNVICMNGCVCRPLLLDYTCECLGNSYSDRHCKIVAKKIIGLYCSYCYGKCCNICCNNGYILKYYFGIDSVHDERERYRRQKQAKQRKPRVIERFIYVNATPQQQCEGPISTDRETTI